MVHPTPVSEADIEKQFLKSMAGMLDGVAPVKPERLKQIYSSHAQQPCVVCNTPKLTTLVVKTVHDRPTNQINDLYFCCICDKCTPCDCEWCEPEFQARLKDLQVAIHKARMH